MKNRQDENIDNGAVLETAATQRDYDKCVYKRVYYMSAKALQQLQEDMRSAATTTTRRRPNVD
jgi:hypothetical protein